MSIVDESTEKMGTIIKLMDRLEERKLASGIDYSIGRDAPYEGPEDELSPSPTEVDRTDESYKVKKKPPS